MTASVLPVFTSLKITPVLPLGISAEQSTSTQLPVVLGVLSTQLVKKLKPLPEGRDVSTLKLWLKE
jgi:hypothetical protein